MAATGAPGVSSLRALSLRDYEDLAVRLASDPQLLAHLRHLVHRHMLGEADAGAACAAATTGMLACPAMDAVHCTAERRDEAGKTRERTLEALRAPPGAGGCGGAVVPPQLFKTLAYVRGLEHVLRAAWEAAVAAANSVHGAEQEVDGGSAGSGDTDAEALSEQGETEADEDDHAPVDRRASRRHIGTHTRAHAFRQLGCTAAA